MHYNRIQKTLRLLIYVLTVMTPVGIAIMLNPGLKEKYLWTTNIFLLLQFAALVIYLLLNYTGKSVLISTITLVVSGYLLEYIGVKTNYPFGSYFYTETLQPQIAGVPTAISMSWTLVVASSYLIVLKSKKLNIFATVVYSAALVLAFDFMLEPFASFINKYWTWTLSYVPVQNYITWFLTAAIFTIFLKKALKAGSHTENDSGITSVTPLMLYGISTVQFTVINIYNHFYIETLSGAILIATILIIIHRKTNEI